jgi:hypothetical protein
MSTPTIIDAPPATPPQPQIAAPAQQQQTQSQTGAKPKARQWRGIRYYLTTIWSGPQADAGLPKAVDHAAWARSFGRKIALPLMFLFSIGAVVKLTKDALQRDIGYIIAGDMTDLAKNALSLVVILVVGGLVIGMDTLLVVKCVDWMDKRANNEDFSAERNLVWFVSVVESVTFALLLQSVENPASPVVNGQINPQGLTDWGLILIRAVGVPIVTTSLATLGDKVITPKEQRNQLKAQADNVIALSLKELALQPSLANLPAIMAYRTSLDDLTPEQEEAKNRKNEQLFLHFQRIMPGAIDMAAQSRIEALEREKQQAIETTMHEAEIRIQAIMRNMLPWLFHVIEHQEWPDELIEAAPEYARIPVVAVLKKGGINAKHAGIAASSAPASAADDLRKLCEGRMKVVTSITEHNAKPDERGKKPTKKPKGVWIRSSDIPQLTGGVLTQDEAKELAAKWGNEAKDGNAYAAPLRQILKDLARRTQLVEPWLSWQKAHEGDANGDESGENPAA